jgi:hypothetical protein
MRSRNGITFVVFGLVLALGVLVAEAAHRPDAWAGRCINNGDLLQIITGDWVSGLDGCGIIWGDKKAGHASGTVRIEPGKELRAWIQDGHVIAIDVDGITVRARTAPTQLGHPDIAFNITPGRPIIFWLNSNKEIEDVEQ